MKHARLTLALTLLLLMPLVAGCGGSKTVTEFVPVEVVKQQRTPVPQELLTRHCSDLELSDLGTQGDMEEALVRAWICVQDHNRDKDEIDARQAD